jgi:large-conductance mechanosensitive channel
MLGIVYLVVLYMQERAREKRKQREREQEPEGEPLLVCPVRDLLSTHSDWLRM